MSKPDPGAHYLEPYRRSHRRHGPAFGVTLWASPESQRTRFRVFTESVFLGGKTVLDAGCSRGDFAAYLVEKDVPIRGYLGIDALCDVIDFAQGRGLPGCEFRCGDFVTHPEVLASARADVVCVSGTLNTMDDAHAFAVLESAWAAAGEALLFNFLSDRCGPGAPPQDAFARRLDALRLLSWAAERTWSVVFRQDYFRDGHDATIVMRRVSRSTPSS